MDCIRFHSHRRWRYNQVNKINILIENVTIDRWRALPILITDGTYGTVTPSQRQDLNTTAWNNVSSRPINVGSVDKLIIDNVSWPGRALIGRPGSIGEVLVRELAWRASG